MLGPSTGPTRYEETVDVRGSRVGDALETVEGSLDQALASQSRYVRIIHGKGSGALQTGIRAYCKTSPYVKNFRSGDPAEGGEGVTIIELV